VQLFVLLLLAVAGAAENDVVAQAQAEISNLRRLVEAGAAPQAQLERAEAALEDARDDALLRRTLYGEDLTEAQTDVMVDAARRRLDRRQRAVEEARGRILAGVATELSLGGFLEALDLARREFDLAESRARLCREVSRMAQAEQEYAARLERAPEVRLPEGDRFDGGGALTTLDLVRLESAFAGHFGKPLPVSAAGDTAVHRALGFDHRGRVDVAVHPDQPEGRWLRGYLAGHNIPFYAFRQAVPGKATGAHIHVGPLSTRIAKGG
jgi:hypothetical protein